MKKPKIKSYTTYFKLIVELSLDVEAGSYEQALGKAREMSVKDLVDFDHDFNDGSVAVIGVYNPQEEPK